MCQPRCVYRLRPMEWEQSYLARERKTSPPLPHECDAPRPKQRRRGRGLAVTVLTLVSAGALVAFTAVSTSHIIGRGSHYRTASPLTVGSRAVASATCAAWPSAKLDIDTVSALPAGWYWDTTFSRSNLQDHAAAVSPPALPAGRGGLFHPRRHRPPRARQRPRQAERATGQDTGLISGEGCTDINEQPYQEVFELLTRIGDDLQAIEVESRESRRAERAFDANCSTPSA